MSIISEVADKSFDYVIVGGGTAGLTLATRLTENPNVTVAVLEAGQPNINEPNILIPAQWGMTFGDPKFDWFFQTTPQKHANNMTYPWNRGKGLGGSSALNFYVWVKPPSQDMDALEKLGNPSWNWNEFYKYTRKTETFHPPTLEHHKTFDHTYRPENRGTDGPIQTCIPYHTTLEKPWQETMVNLGAQYIDDPYGGNITGTWVCTNNLDPRTHTRSYSTTGYYLPNAGRPNLTVLTEALGHKVLSKKESNGSYTATGVEFVHEGQTFVVHAKKEVICSTGALKTPQLLELSGIGSKKILEPLGIDCKIDLPGVGENLQEHMFIHTVWKLNPDTPHETFDLMRTPGFAEEQKKLHAENKGMHRLGLTSFAYLPYRFAFDHGEEKELIENKVAELEKNKDKYPPGLWAQYKLMIENLRNEAVPDLELAIFPGFFGSAGAPEEGARYISALGVLNHPFSRGDVHIKSKNPEEYPTMDAHYFEDEFDMTNMISHLKMFRRIRETEPFKSMVVGEVQPGPELQTDEQLRDYVCKHMTTAWHGLGTTAMLPREHAGVVDPQLKVYGTNNLRVVDLGIIPLHLATHTHSVAYVIGEKAADIIKSTW